MKSIALALFNYLAIIWRTQSSERTRKLMGCSFNVWKDVKRQQLAS